MISVSNVSMRYGAKVLFEDVSVNFITGRRYGLTGPNGAGKSTFMKVLTGELDAQKGSVVRPKKVGVLRQDQYAFDAYRVIDTVSSINVNVQGISPALMSSIFAADRVALSAIQARGLCPCHCCRNGRWAAACSAVAQS